MLIRALGEQSFLTVIASITSVMTAGLGEKMPFLLTYSYFVVSPILHKLTARGTP